MQTTYINAAVYTGDAVLPRASVSVCDGRIVAVDPANGRAGEGEIIDLEGRILAPAFIDLQVYGGNGYLFNNEPTAETIRQTYASVHAGGACRFQITLSSSPPEVMWAAIDACRTYWNEGGQGLIGLHLEGPYFNPDKRGAHPLEYIRQPNPADIADLIERGRGVVTYMTIAPEQFDDASLDLLLNSGIVLSAGHSNATFAQAVRGFDKGIRRATHLFNAMSAFQSREPGMVGAVYARKPWASIIADGVHCHYESLKISKQILGDRLFLITDAVTDSDSGNYRFHLAGDRYLDANGTLAGSALTMWQAVRNCIHHADIEPAEALRMASLYPAQAIGLDDRLGRIAPGYLAELVTGDADWLPNVHP